VNKSQLIEALAWEAGLSSEVSSFAVNEIFRLLSDTLAKGEGIEIRGFGSFTVREYKSYMGRNPKSGERIKVPPKSLPFFKVGKELRERVINKVEIKE
jgi:integration host factor subunit beta